MCGGTCVVWRDMCSVAGHVQCVLNLTQINPPQWKHIMHRQLSPIGEVGIYKNTIHIIRECVLTHTRVLTLHRSIPLNGNTSCIAS